MTQKPIKLTPLANLVIAAAALAVAVKHLNDAAHKAFPGLR